MPSSTETFSAALSSNILHRCQPMLCYVVCPILAFVLHVAHVSRCTMTGVLLIPAGKPQARPCLELSRAWTAPGI